MGGQLYLVALGSNVRHPHFGAPRRVLAAAMAALDGEGGHVLARAPIVETAPMGPSHRRYANGACLVRTERDPEAMLRHLQCIEHRFGRRRMGRRWRARVLDLDIVLWNGGAYAVPDLTIPHPAFRERAFVLAPVTQIAGDWRDPISGLSTRQLFARLTKPHPLRRGSDVVGPLAQSVEQLTFNQ